MHTLPDSTIWERKREREREREKRKREKERKKERERRERERKGEKTFLAPLFNFHGVLKRCLIVNLSNGKCHFPMILHHVRQQVGRLVGQSKFPKRAANYTSMSWPLVRILQSPSKTERQQFYTGYRQARTQDFSLRGVRFYQYDYFAFIFIPIPPDVGF